MNTIARSKFGDCVECNAKDTHCVKVGKSLYCLECRNSEKRKQQISRFEIKQNNKSTISSQSDRQELTHDLDFIFSRYIRIKEADKDGFTICYTCDKREHWTKLQAGHYIKRSETYLRWDSRNARPQCVNCNCNLHGNINEYNNRLESEFPGIADQLREESREVYKYGRDELKQLLIDLRAKLRMVESKLK